MNTYFKLPMRYSGLLFLTFFMTKPLYGMDSLSERNEIQKMHILNLCVYQGDIASGVQMVRHQEDHNYYVFRTYIQQLFAINDIPYENTLKVLEIGKDVYTHLDKRASSSTAFLVYYTECLNHMQSAELPGLSTEGFY